MGRAVASLVVTLTRIAPRALDDDNLRGALKACRDGVADWLAIDDRDPRVRWEYAQRKGKPGQYAVAVEVTETPDGWHPCPTRIELPAPPRTPLPPRRARKVST